MKKLKKSTIVLIVLAIVCLLLSVASEKYSVSRTIKAIDEIGEMRLDNGSMERFEQAADYYMALDPNRNLEEKVSNRLAYREAKLNYARILIKSAVLADKKQDGAAEAVAAARTAVDTYFTEDEVWDIENYQDLVDLESAYNSDGSGSGGDSGEAPPMC